MCYHRSQRAPKAKVHVPMNKYGPTRGDLKFRLAFSGVGLVLLVSAIAYRGWPKGPGGWEAIGIATVFFGGTFVWTLIKLIRGDHPDGL